MSEWLGAVVRHVDSSLIDEWERLTQIDQDASDNAEPTPGSFTTGSPSIVENKRAFAVMVRNEMFRWVQLIARKRRDLLPEGDHSKLDLYWEEFDELLIDADARNAERFSYDHTSGIATQTLHDPLDVDAWRIEGTVDVQASIEQGQAVLQWSRTYSLESNPN